MDEMNGKSEIRNQLRAGYQKKEKNDPRSLSVIYSELDLDAAVFLKNRILR